MRKIFLITLGVLLSIVIAFEIYITASGRNTKLSKEDLKKRLTPLQYHVTQEGGTETPFDNTFWNHKEAGIYIDIVTGEALFSSTDKFDSKSGWPSFTKPINKSAVETREDNSLFMKRIEALSNEGKSHLGHVFDDGPQPTGKRYCINSSSLKFIPVNQLEKSGYAQYLPLFKKEKSNKQEEIAILAGGCFWCVEAAFDKLSGVIRTTSGYIDGTKDNPSYQDVSSGKSGHTEAVEITFDPDVISYDNILEYFWMNIDPTQKNRQFCDTGSQYRTGIYYLNEEQKNKAISSQKHFSKKLAKSLGSIHTEIKKSSVFYPAEAYHQNFYKTNPVRYKQYYQQCGREKRLKEIWPKEMRESLIRETWKLKK